MMIRPRPGVGETPGHETGGIRIPPACVLMALIWVIIGIINVAYAMRKHSQQ